MPELCRKALLREFSHILANSPTQELNTAGEETSKMCDRSFVLKKRQRKTRGPLLSLWGGCICVCVCRR